MEDSFVVINIFTYDHEAHLFMAKLENEEIRCNLMVIT